MSFLAAFGRTTTYLPMRPLKKSFWVLFSPQKYVTLVTLILTPCCHLAPYYSSNKGVSERYIAFLYYLNALKPFTDYGWPAGAVQREHVDFGYHRNTLYKPNIFQTAADARSCYSQCCQGDVFLGQNRVQKLIPSALLPHKCNQSGSLSSRSITAAAARRLQ